MHRHCPRRYLINGWRVYVHLYWIITSTSHDCIQQIHAPTSTERRERYLALLVCAIAHDRIDVFDHLIRMVQYAGDVSMCEALIMMCTVYEATRCYVFLCTRLYHPYYSARRIYPLVRPAPHIWSLELCNRHVWLEWLNRMPLRNKLDVLTACKAEAGDHIIMKSNVHGVVLDVFNRAIR
jgi:hypothetical protein